MTEGLDVPANEAIEVEALLRRVSPDVAAVVDEHIEDNDEVLPTLLLADAARWYVDVVASGLAVDAARRLLDGLDVAFQRADANLQNTIATGFLETLPAPDEKGRESVDLLPSSLREKLDRMETGTHVCGVVSPPPRAVLGRGRRSSRHREPRARRTPPSSPAAAHRRA